MTKGVSTRSLPRPAPLGTRGSSLMREAAPGRMAGQTRIPLRRGTGPKPRTRSALTARRNGMQRRSRRHPQTDPPKPMPPRPRRIAAARSPSVRQMAWARRTRHAPPCPRSGPPGPRPRRAGPSRPRPHSSSGPQPKKTAQALPPSTSASQRDGATGPRGLVPRSSKVAATGADGVPPALRSRPDPATAVGRPSTLGTTGPAQGPSRLPPAAITRTGSSEPGQASPAGRLPAPSAATDLTQGASAMSRVSDAPLPRARVLRWPRLRPCRPG